MISFADVYGVAGRLSRLKLNVFRLMNANVGIVMY